MPTLIATNRIRTRETALTKDAIIGVYKRRSLRRSIGLTLQPALYSFCCTNWTNIIEKITITDPKLGAQMNQTLKNKNISLNETILTRDTTIDIKNVWALLMRQELRQILDLPLTTKTFITYPLAKILELGLTTRGLNAQEALVANYFGCWYMVFDDPENLTSLLNNPLLAVPKKFLQECYDRACTTTIPLPRKPTLATEEHAQTTKLFRRTFFLRGHSKLLTENIFKRAEVRLLLGFPPLTFNSKPSDLQEPDKWAQPIALQEIISAADHDLFPIDQTQYDQSLLQHPVWIRERAVWQDLSRYRRKDIATSILQRASLRTMFRLEPLSTLAHKTTLSQAIVSLMPTSQIKSTIEHLISVGFYDDPKSGLLKLVAQLSGNDKHTIITLSTYFAAYMIINHFSKINYNFQEAAKEFLSILQESYPNAPKFYGKIVAYTAHNIFHTGNPHHQYLWPIGYSETEDPEKLFVFIMSLIMNEQNNLLPFWRGLTQGNSDFHASDMGRLLVFLIENKQLDKKDLPKIIDQIVTNLQWRDPREKEALLDNCFGNNDQDYNDCLAQLYQFPSWYNKRVHLREQSIPA